MSGFLVSHPAGPGPQLLREHRDVEHDPGLTLSWGACLPRRGSCSCCCSTWAPVPKPPGRVVRADPKPSHAQLTLGHVARASRRALAACRSRGEVREAQKRCGRPPNRNGLMVQRSWCKSLPGQGMASREWDGEGSGLQAEERGRGCRGLKRSGTTHPPDVGTNFLQGLLGKDKGRWF